MRAPGEESVILVLAAAMSLAPGVRAQEQILTTEFRRLPDGRGELAVTNNSEGPMVTAFVILRQSFRPGRNQPIARGLDFRDVLFTPEQHNFADAIMPLETRRFRSGALSQEIRNEIELKAAVFSDGTTWGDPEWVQRILKCRHYLYDDLGLAIEKIKAALDAGAPIELLRQEFEQLRDSTPRPGRDFEHFEEAQAAGNVFGTVLGNLPQSSTSAQELKGSLATFLPVLMTWQKIIGDAKPSILRAGVRNSAQRAHPSRDGEALCCALSSGAATWPPVRRKREGVV